MEKNIGEQDETVQEIIERDIELQKAVEKARRSEDVAKKAAARIEAIINNLPGMVYQCVYDPPFYSNIFVSDAVEEITGYSRTEYHNMAFNNIVHPEDLRHVNKTITETLYNKESVETTYRIISKDGTEKWVMDRRRVMEYNPDGTPYSLEGYISDITTHKQLESAEREKEKAELASRAKSVFLANMSHEIRTPMNTIMGVTEMLTQEEGLSRNIEEGLSKIYTASTLLLSLINDILDFSKIDAGKMEICPVDYELASLIVDTTQLNMVKLGSKPIQFALEIDENLPKKLNGDELRIKQILNNLLSNAFKYTQIGEITLIIGFEPDEEGIILNLCVKDTGLGMSEEQLNTLFEEYSRFTTETEYGVEGTGLGLTITRNLLELMGGTIEVDSEYGKGSIFTVRLPQKTVNAETLGKEMVENLKSFRMSFDKERNRRKEVRNIMPYGSVLIVDDVEANLYVAKGLLKPYKVKVDTVMTGHDAIEKISIGKVYDIIFMDHMMPGMSGVEVTARLRKMGYDAPIVALTANAVVGQAEMFLENGFNEFISKPIDIRKLDAILVKYVRDNRSPKVIESMRFNDTDEGVELSAVTQILKSKTIKGLDIVKALERYNNNGDMYLDILRSYTAGNRSTLDSLMAINANNLEAYEIAIHGVRGSSTSVLAEDIGQQANKLEEAAIKKDIDYIKMHNPAFIEELLELTGNIEELVREIDSSGIKPKKDKPDEDVLKKLADASKAYSMNDAEVALAELDAFDYETDGDLVKWLREKVSMVDFPDIVERLSYLD